MLRFCIGSIFSEGVSFTRESSSYRFTLFFLAFVNMKRTLYAFYTKMNTIIVISVILTAFMLPLLEKV